MQRKPRRRISKPWLLRAFLFCGALSCCSGWVSAYGHAGPNGGAHRLIDLLALETFIRQTAQDPILRKYDFYPEAKKYGLRPAPGDRLFVVKGLTVVDSNWFKAKEEVRERPFYWWIREGGASADAPGIYMGMRHFYDPTSKGGVAHLTDFVGDRAGIEDALTWALSRSPHALAEAQRYFLAARSASGFPGRGELLAACWRCIGEAMHILADLTVPAHVRNDAHPADEPYEDNINDAWISGYLADRTSIWTIPDLLRDEIEQCRTPRALMHTVALHVNAHFFSNDTIAGRDPASGRMVKPRNGEPDYDEPRLEQCNFDEVTGYYLADDYQGKLLMASRVRWGSPIVDLACAQSQARRLIPLAVAACARLLALSLPRVEVTVDAYDRQAKILRGHVAVYEEAEDGSRRLADLPGFPFTCGMAVLFLSGPAGDEGTGTTADCYLLPLEAAGGTGEFQIILSGPGKASALTARLQAEETEENAIWMRVGLDLGGILVRSEAFTSRSP